MTGRRLLFMLVLLAGLVASPAASASTASISGGALVYTAAAGEANIVVIGYQDGSGYTITETGSDANGMPIGINPDVASGCTPSGPQSVHCSGTINSVSVNAGDGDDSVQYDGPAPATVDGAAGDDSLRGGPAADRLSGGAGSDTLDGGGGDDTLDGGDANDSLLGGTGNDVLRGGDGADTLGAGAGNDTLDGGGGPDVLSGGDGEDTVDYSGRVDPVNVSVGSDANDGGAGEGDDVQSDVEDVIGGAGDDTITGDDADNVLIGGAGNDTLDGAGGNDTLDGDGGNDMLAGGAGNDTLSGGPGNDGVAGGPGADLMSGGDGSDFTGYFTRTAPVTVTLDGMPNDGEAGEGDNVMTDVEGVYGGEGADTLIGDDADNILVGLGGNDVVDGGGGNDILDAGLGANVVRGGAGNDFVSYAEGGGVQASLNGLADDGDPGQGDLIATDVENVIGSDGSDHLVGNAGANTLVGGAGNDSLDGGAGSDVMDGGDGDDTIEAADGAADGIACGAGGDDYAHADALDNVQPDCEHVLVDVQLQLPAGGLSLSRTRRVEIPMTCPAAAIQGCAGSLTLLLADKRISRRSVRLASARWRAAPKQSADVVLRLTRNDWTVIRGLKAARIRLTLEQTAGSGHANTLAVSTKLGAGSTKRAHKKRKHHHHRRAKPRR